MEETKNYTYRMIIAYDGTEYHGWQVQLTHTTVAGLLIQTFQSVFNQPCVLLGASRTDSGVHAYGQVARLRTPFCIDGDDMKRILNNALPESVFVREITAVAPEFHPHVGVQSKEYWYHLFTQRPLPFFSRFGWFPEYESRKIDWSVFKEALQLFVGEHDFASFCRNEEGKSTRRSVDAIEVRELPRYKALRVVIKGKGFLQYQIRRMVGAAITVASRESVSLDDIRRLLTKPEKLTIALHKAKAQGLLLRRISYE